jgi:hypothetical protein
MRWSNLVVVFIAPTFGKISSTCEIKIFALVVAGIDDVGYNIKR